MNATYHGIQTVAEGLPSLMVSYHAYDRAKERLHWRRKAVKRMALRALVSGRSPENSNRLLRAYLSSKESLDGRFLPILYGQLVYVFERGDEGAATTLLTIYRAPNAILRAVASGRRCIAKAIQGEENTDNASNQDELLSIHR